jgi:hypothetical protein
LEVGALDIHKEFLEFTERVLRSDQLDRDSQAPDLHQLLSCIADGDDVYELMENIPDERIGEVLTWVMNVDIQGDI